MFTKIADRKFSFAKKTFSGRYDQLSAHGGSCSKSVEISDTSIVVSSLAKDLSQSPSQSSFRDVSFV